MSVELGVPNRRITYLNVSKTGKEHIGDFSEFCTSTVDFRDSPLLSKMDDNICCVTRFQVPVNQMPRIDAKGFTIYRYPHAMGLQFDSAEHLEAVDTWEENKDNETDYDGSVYHRVVARVDLKPCFTMYEFMEHVTQTLTQTTASAHGHGGSTYAENVKILRERINFVLTPDMRFKVFIKDTGVDNTDLWYIKFDEGTFRWMQFQTGPGYAPSDNRGNRLIPHGVDKYIFEVNSGSSVQWWEHTAHMSCADYSCHKKIVN